MDVLTLGRDERIAAGTAALNPHETLAALHETNSSTNCEAQYRSLFANGYVALIGETWNNNKNERVPQCYGIQRPALASARSPLIIKVVNDHPALLWQFKFADDCEEFLNMRASH